MATIQDLVSVLAEVPEADPFEIGPAIFARRPWTAHSEALLLNEDYLQSPSHPGFELVLEVPIAREVIEVWSAWRDGESPTLEQAVEAVLHYAMHDAYLPTS